MIEPLPSLSQLRKTVARLRVLDVLSIEPELAPEISSILAGSLATARLRKKRARSLERIAPNYVEYRLLELGVVRWNREIAEHRAELKRRCDALTREVDAAIAELP